MYQQTGLVNSGLSSKAKEDGIRKNSSSNIPSKEKEKSPRRHSENDSVKPSRYTRKSSLFTGCFVSRFEEEDDETNFKTEVNDIHVKVQSIEAGWNLVSIADETEETKAADVHKRISGTWYAVADTGPLDLNNRPTIIIYTTSVMAIRKTFDESTRVRDLFLTLGVEFEERDVYINKEYRQELKDRLNGSTAPVPRLFIGDNYIGGFPEIQQLNDDGELRALLQDAGYLQRRRTATITCETCGNKKFVLCNSCQGSRKVLVGNQVSRCSECNENGLVKCKECVDPVQVKS